MQSGWNDEFYHSTETLVLIYQWFSVIMTQSHLIAYSSQIFSLRIADFSGIGNLVQIEAAFRALLVYLFIFLVSYFTHEIFLPLVLFFSGTFKSLSLFPDLSDCLFWSGLQTSATLFFQSSFFQVFQVFSSHKSKCWQPLQDEMILRDIATICHWYQVVLYGIIHYFFRVLRNLTYLWHLFNMICWGNMFGYIFRKC